MNGIARSAVERTALTAIETDETIRNANDFEARLAEPGTRSADAVAQMPVMLPSTWSYPHNTRSNAEQVANTFSAIEDTTDLVGILGGWAGGFAVGAGAMVANYGDEPLTVNGLPQKVMGSVISGAGIAVIFASGEVAVIGDEMERAVHNELLGHHDNATDIFEYLGDGQYNRVR